MKTSAKGKAPMHFDALEIALQIIKTIRGAVAKIQANDPDEARQIKRSLNSVVRNVSEGNRRVGRDRAHLFRIAAGSADEVVGSVRIALAWGWVDEQEVAGSMALLDRELAVLWRLTNPRH